MRWNNINIVNICYILVVRPVHKQLKLDNSINSYMTKNSHSFAKYYWIYASEEHKQYDYFNGLCVSEMPLKVFEVTVSAKFTYRCSQVD